MKQEHESIITRMAMALWAVHPKMDRSNDLERAVKDMIRAANERGYDLVKLPEPMTDLRWHGERRIGHAICLDAVEIVRVDEPEQRREVNAEPYMDDPCRGY